MNISTCLPQPTLGTSQTLRRAHALPACGNCASPRPSSQPAVLPTLRPSHSLLPLRRMSTLASSPSQTASTADSSTKRRPKTKEELHDPAPIGATGKATTRVKDQGGDISLSKYMTLPVEQYFVLDPSQVQHIGDNRFLLRVPKVNILNAWLEPEVEIETISSLDPPKVVLQASNCRIRGSEGIENWKLDQRFCLSFTTELTWSSEQEQSEEGPSKKDPSKEGPRTGQIVGNAKLEVWSEVIPPFTLMPRPMMQGSCNVVMAGLVNTLLPLFLRKLGEDYMKWSTEPEYREARARRSMPINSLEEVQLQGGGA